MVLSEALQQFHCSPLQNSSPPTVSANSTNLSQPETLQNIPQNKLLYYTAIFYFALPYCSVTKGFNFFWFKKITHNNILAFFFFLHLDSEHFRTTVIISLLRITKLCEY